MQQGAVPTGEGIDAVVELLQPPPFFGVAAAQKDRRQHRGQGKSVESGNGDGECDGQRKLAKQNAGRPGKERNRNKHSNQHQRCSDDGAGNLGRGRRRRFVGVVFALVNMALNVFNHDDRVIDHQTSSERDTEQRQRVDGEAEQLHEDERTDQRNRSGDEVNHRRSPVAEKDKDDQDDQQDRRTYREGHVANRLAHRVGRVECDLACMPGRKPLLQPLQFGNRFRSTSSAFAVESCVTAIPMASCPLNCRVGGVILRAEFGVSDVFQPDQRAIGIGFQNDVVELRRLAQPAHRPHADLVRLSQH